jgi:hypothetical protein
MENIKIHYSLILFLGDPADFSWCALGFLVF